MACCCGIESSPECAASQNVFSRYPPPNTLGHREPYAGIVDTFIHIYI
jgi:hypothetical protein